MHVNNKEILRIEYTCKGNVNFHITCIIVKGMHVIYVMLRL